MGPAAQLLAVAERSDDARVDLKTVAGREQRHVLGEDLGLVLRNEGGTPQVVGLCLRLREERCGLALVGLGCRETRAETRVGAVEVTRATGLSAQVVERALAASGCALAQHFDVRGLHRSRGEMRAGC